MTTPTSFFARGWIRGLSKASQGGWFGLSTLLTSRFGLTGVLFVMVGLLLVAKLDRSNCGVAAEPDPEKSIRYRVGWFGNSYNGKTKWVLQDVDDIFVSPAGDVWTNVTWDEAGGNVQHYRNGSLVLETVQHTHGWGYEGGRAVTANSRFLFIAQMVGNEGGGLKGGSWPATPNGVWSGISRRSLKHPSDGASFQGGVGGEGDTLRNCFLVVDELEPDNAAERRTIHGLVATEDELFIASLLRQEILVYDAERMVSLRSWPVPYPGSMALDQQGNLWVLSYDVERQPVAELRCYGTAEGTLLRSLVLEPDMIPTDLCIDSADRLYFADRGPRQQVHVVTGLEGEPRLRESLGARGGVFAGPVPGRMGPWRFHDPRGVGVDQAGNLYVASSGSSGRRAGGGGGSTVMECYGPDQKLLWQQYGICFVDNGDHDPVDQQSLLTKEERYEVVAEPGDGPLAKPVAVTCDPFRFPNDPRNHVWSANPWVLRLDDRRLLFVTDMTGTSLQVYRFDPDQFGELAIPCALISPRPNSLFEHIHQRGAAADGWIWLDRNRDGQMTKGEFESLPATPAGHWIPDNSGGLWLAGGDVIRHLPLSGVNQHGMPQWRATAMRTWPRPHEFDEIRRLRYLPERDVLLVSGNRGDNRNQHWKPMGPVLVCYDDWIKGKPSVRWQKTLPFRVGSQGHESREPASFDVAGDFVFVAYCRDLGPASTGSAQVDMYRLPDGELQGTMGAAAEFGEVGLLDLVESVRAVERTGRGIRVFLEDDYRGKVIVFDCQSPQTHDRAKAKVRRPLSPSR